MAEVVTLNTGEEMPANLVAVTMFSLRGLMQEGHAIAVYEAREMAKDPSHQPFGNAGEILESRGLAVKQVNGTYELQGAVRDIVLAAIQGDGFNARLVNPIKA